MNVIGQIDPSAFAAAQRLHHREAEPTLEFPYGVSSRRRGLLALRAQNWRASGGGGWEPTPNAYVETDGVCYIDTGWVPTATGAYEMDWKCSGGIHGAMYTGGASRYYAAWSSGELFCGRQDRVLVSGFFFGTRCVIGVDNFNSSAHINETTHTIGAISWLPLTTFLIGARHNGTNVDNKGRARVWRFQAWDSGTLVHDFHPREMDGVAGLWDVVTEQFVTGTGGALSYGINES